MPTKRVIVIGCRESWDWEYLAKIARWSSINGHQELAHLIWAETPAIISKIAEAELDHYDMTTKPRKGDAYVALREHKDTVAVIALHLYGLDEKKHPKCSDMESDQCAAGYRYTKHNHKLLDLCLKRNIPFIVVGDQPIYDDAGVPKHISRTAVIICPETAPRPIYIYERAK